MFSTKTTNLLSPDKIIVFAGDNGLVSQQKSALVLQHIKCIQISCERFQSLDHYLFWQAGFVAYER